MSRTQAEVADSIRSRTANSDPRLDTAKGYLSSGVIVPNAGEIADIEEKTEHTRLLYSTKYFENATDEEIQLWAENVGIGIGFDNVALVTLTFWRYSPPSSDVVIPSGVVVGTSDSAIKFYSSETKTMYFSAASAYYNSSKRRYEINVRAAALGPGSEYEVAPYSLTSLLSDVSGVDGVENQISAVLPTNSRGLRTRDVLEDRIQNKLLGTTTGLGGRVVLNVVDFDPENIRRVNLVFSTDRENYFGDGRRPALDVYVDSTRALDSRTEVFTGIAGTNDYQLTTTPAKAITRVLINGTQITDFSLVVDTALATRYSTEAQDRLSLGSTVVVNNGDEIEVEYSYNSLLKALSEGYPYDGLFATDLLYREPILYSIDVSLTLVALTSVVASIEDDAETAVLKYFNQQVDFGDVMTATELRDYVRSEVAYASEVYVTKFTPTLTGVADVEAITLPPYGLPTPGTINVSKR